MCCLLCLLTSHALPDRKHIIQTNDFLSTLGTLTRGCWCSCGINATHVSCVAAAFWPQAVPFVGTSHVLAWAARENLVRARGPANGGGLPKARRRLHGSSHKPGGNRAGQRAGSRSGKLRLQRDPKNIKGGWRGDTSSPKRTYARISIRGFPCIHADQGASRLLEQRESSPSDLGQKFGVGAASGFQG